MTDLQIEVFADLWCPFTHVGLRAAAALRQELGRGDVVLRVRPWPLELVNGAPMDPAKAAHNADELRRQVAPGLFAHVDIAHFPTSTLAGLALVEAAYRRGPRAGERASFVLRDALFEQGRDLSDPAVLAVLAAELDVAEVSDEDRGAVLGSWEEGRRRGVLGSPHFFCGGFDSFCPSLSITREGAAMAVERSQAALREFLAACLRPKD